MYTYALAARTMSKKYSGTKCEGIVGLTRTGKCPTCGKRVETSYTDIFFPYCGYGCKRVVQRQEEEEAKRQIAEQDRKYRERKIKERERRELARQRKIIENQKRTEESEEKMVQRIRETKVRIEQCEAEVKKWEGIAKGTKSGTIEYRRSRKNLCDWRRKENDAKKVFAWLQKQSAQNDLNNETKETGRTLKGVR